MRPRVSVSITNYNYGHLIRRAIESVQRQTLEDFELVVVDNASTDDSVSVVRRYADKDKRIRLLANDVNLGLSRSLQLAGEASSGTYRVHIDADDWVIDPEAFELQVSMLERHPAMSFVFSPVTLADPTGRLTQVTSLYPQDTVLPGEIAIRHALLIEVVNTGPMMRNSAFRDLGGYNLDYMHAIDVKLAIDLCGQGQVGYISRPLYAFFQHSSSMGHVGSVSKLQDDMIRAIESAFTGPIGPRIRNPSSLRSQAIRHTMLLHATQLVFNGHYRLGWKTLLQSAIRRPGAVLGSSRTVALAARTLLGPSGYTRIHGILSCLRP